MEQKGDNSVRIFSHSRLSTFEQCKMKYKFRYVDKIIVDMEKTIESHLGSSVHNALEWLYKQVKNGSVPTIDEMVVAYSGFWKADYDNDILIVKKTLTPEHYFNKGVQFLINYYTEHKPFDDNTLDVEKEIEINLDSDGRYKIRGFIDRLTYNLKTGEYEVHDYKTSSSFPSEEAIANDRQLALYSIAIKETFGKDKIVRLVWHYLSFNKKVHSHRTNEQLEKLKKDTIELIGEIESTKSFEPNKSTLCHWCEFKSICPAWGNRQPEKQMKLDKF